MAPKAQRYQEETSLSSNWRFGPHHLMAVLGVLEMIVGVVFLWSCQRYVRSRGWKGMQSYLAYRRCAEGGRPLVIGVDQQKPCGLFSCLSLRYSGM